MSKYGVAGLMAWMQRSEHWSYEKPGGEYPDDIGCPEDEWAIAVGKELICPLCDPAVKPEEDIHFHLNIGDK